MSNIKQVYNGLPHEIVREILWVARSYRTNQLSHTPGGSDVVVEYHNGNVFGYDWIKKPSAYIDKIFKDTFERDHDIILDELDEDEQLDTYKSVVKKIYARRYTNDAEQSQAVFKEVWSSSTSNLLPQETLQDFEGSLKTRYNKSNNSDYDEPLEDLPF